MKNLKEKIVGAAGSASGAASILGSWQVCHNVCLALIALLSVLGITVTGMPLAFFTEIAVPVWLAAVVLLVIVLILYFKKHCISRWMLIVNLGLIIAGTPFQQVQKYNVLLWSVGGVLVLAGIVDYIKSRRKCVKCKE